MEKVFADQLGIDLINFNYIVINSTGFTVCNRHPSLNQTREHLILLSKLLRAFDKELIKREQG